MVFLWSVLLLNRGQTVTHLCLMKEIKNVLLYTAYLHLRLKMFKRKMSVAMSLPLYLKYDLNFKISLLFEQNYFVSWTNI